MSDAAEVAREVGRRLDGIPLALMLDVDGTLAPIAPTPEAAAVPSNMREVVRRLASTDGTTVALVSGRAVADAWRVAGVDGAWVIGNHGFEVRAPDGSTSAMDEVRPYESVIAEAAQALLPIAQEIEGAIVENKRWTLSVHYRLVGPIDSEKLVGHAHQVAHALNLRVTRGKKIVELRPPLLVNKGTAVLAFLHRIGALSENASSMYAGDDDTDEDAFQALRSRRTSAVTVHIAQHRESAGETHAEFTLAAPDELRKLLEWLLRKRTQPEQV